MSVENELNGLKYFVSKKLEKEVFGKKTGIITKVKILNQVKKEKPKSKFFINTAFTILAGTMIVPLSNLVIALSTSVTPMHLLKEVAVLGGSCLLAYVGMNLVGNNYKDTIKELQIERSLPSIKLNEGDMLEIGMYLSNEEKEKIAKKIYKDDNINLLTINDIILMKEKLAVEEKKKKMADYLYQM